jgi:hypothetical protein
VLFASAALLAMLSFQLWIDPHIPPGFGKDEAAFSFNAWSIGHRLRDEYGGFLPLYFKSFGDYKSPIFVYVLAAIFRVTGPQESVARLLATVDVLAALLVLGVIGRRKSRPGVAVAVVIAAGFCPWLYELGRVALDTSLFPLGLCGVLLATDISLRSRRNVWARAGLVAFALGFLTYCYAGGRLLGPLLAVGLICFASRERLRWLLLTWLGYGLVLAPLAVYGLRHPQALLARYHETSFIQKGMSVPSIVSKAASNYVHDVNLWHWLIAGDPRPYIDITGYGDLSAALAVLGMLGVVEIVWHRRDDRWWRFAIWALLATPIPSALTVQRFYALRLSPLPIVLAVLAIPGIELLLGLRHPARLGLGLLTVLTLVTAVQWLHFVDIYSQRAGPDRDIIYESDLPSLLSRAFAGGATVYIDHDDHYAQVHARWYAVSHGLPDSRVSILPDGGIPPKHAMVFGRLQACDYICRQLASGDTYWIARAIGPRPSPFAPVSITYGSGFNAPEQYQGSTHRWMIQSGRLELDDHNATSTVTLTGLTFSNRIPRKLELEDAAGHVLAHETVPEYQVPLHLGPFRLRRGRTTLTLIATPGPAVLGPTDPRKATIYLSPLEPSRP